MRGVVFLAAGAMLAASQQTYYWRYPNSDAPNEDISQMVGAMPDQLMSACNALPACLAFNTNGYLKRSIVDLQPAIGDLWVKQTVKQPPRLSVWPQPVKMLNGSSMLLVSSSFSFIASNPSADLEAAFARYQRLTFPHTTPTKETKNFLFPESQGTVTALTVTVKNVTVPLQLGVDESYSLTIAADGTASLTANTVYGAYRGLETFSQLVHYDFDLENYRLDFAPLYITDAPQFAWRGLLIDTSRHFQPLQSIFNTLDAMSYTKLNVLHWHIVDYQSWPIQSRAYPLLWSAAWSPSERYTLQDAADVVEYGRQRGILVIPEFDTPGHADAVCTGYPQACPAPDCTSPLNPANNLTLQLIQGVLAEWATVFPAKYMHLGGDEVDTTCWTNSATISAWMAQRGYTPDETYEYFVLQTDRIANALGRSAVRWEEVWNHFGTSLPADTIIHVWLDHATLGNVTANKYYGVLSDNDVYYLDHLDVPWTAFYDNDLLQNIASSNAGYVLGGETCMWGETVDVSDILQTIAPRFAAAAERQWSYQVVTNSSDPTVEPRLADFRCLLMRRGVPAAPLSNAMARQAPSGPGSCLWQ